MQRGEVGWVEFDPAAGSEIRKTRLGIIVSNNSANRNLLRVIVVPLSSNTERIYSGEARVSCAGTSSKTMDDQIMTTDKVRLKSRIDALSKEDMLVVEHALQVQLALPR